MGRKRQNRKTFGARDDSRRGAGWSELVKENPKWESYYREHLALLPAEEWDEFKTSCQTPLPMTFRVTGSRDHAHEILTLLKERHLPQLEDVEFEGQRVKSPMELKWYPEHLAWQLDVPKTVVRKHEQFAKMQRFLVLETAVGNISRQEAVSMIPPLVLHVEPHHTVLDMCAAPGSKTAQLLEALHADTDEPTGFVVANDSDARRSHMLVHQLKRLNSANLLVVNHDAQFFPRVKLQKEQSKHAKILQFDRILCDVPCSGDGTMRKNVNVWKDWNPQGALGLHTVQYNILNRGLHLLKNKGRLVYSTCSLNPIENEAVVAQALRAWKGKVKIIDCQDELPGLIRSTGVSQWPVINRDFKALNPQDEDVIASWFPPTADEATKFQLDKCMRVYPHQQNTGGFFITVLEKDEGGEQEKSTEENDEPSAKKQKTEPTPQRKVERLPRDANEEPFVFVDPNHEALKNCWEFYGIDDKFDRNTCLVRNATGEPTRIIYTVCSALKNIIEANDDRLKIIYSGVKLFVSQRSDIECAWRVQSESLPIMKHHMHSDRVVPTNLELLKLLLVETFPNMETIEDSKADPNFVAALSKISSGCCFIEVNRQKEGTENLFLPIWKGTKCVNLMVCKEDSQELLYRVFGIETTAKDIPKPQQNGKIESHVSADDSTNPPN